MKKEIFFKLAFIFIIFLNNTLFSQNSKMEDLYKKCWLNLTVITQLNDENKDAEININIKDSIGYEKNYTIKHNKKKIILIPFGSIYNFTIGSNEYSQKWIIINLKDSLDESTLKKLKRKKIALVTVEGASNDTSSAIAYGGSYFFMAQFNLLRNSELPQELKEKMEFKAPMATVIYDKKLNRFDYNEKYTKAIIQKLKEYYNKSEVLLNNPDLLKDYMTMNDSIKAKELMLSKKREELLQERLSLLQKQNENDNLEKEKILKDALLKEERANSISKQKQLDLANQLRINQEQKAKELLLIQQIEREQFLTQKKLIKAEINQQKIIAQAKQKELELANQEKRTKQLEIENATYTKNAYLGLAVFITVIGLIILRAYFIKRNSNTKLQKQNELIAEQKQEITDSIQYAQRIQFAILPTKENIAKAFPQSFILFKPKDIVSGDFYWFQEINHKKYIAACDCTGHGVPGALMSMVATDMLNDALVHTKNVDEILAYTNRSIKTALKQSNDDDSTRDGMDLALCCFDDKTNVLQFAGAYRPLWLIRHIDSASYRNDSGSSTNTLNANSKSSQNVKEVGKVAARDRNDAWELFEYKATKAAIGGLTEDNQNFQLNEIQLQKGDTIYLASDGYADQFSPSDKKLMTKRFKEILLSIQSLNMSEQEKYLDKFITDWRGNMEQTDDVLVIGVRV